jgi:hypothetical protein
MDTHIEAAIIARYRSQHGAVTRQQLLRTGLSRRMIARRNRPGRLLPLLGGVYLLGRCPFPGRTSWRHCSRLDRASC